MNFLLEGLQGEWSEEEPVIGPGLASMSPESRRVNRMRRVFTGEECNDERRMIRSEAEGMKLR